MSADAVVGYGLVALGAVWLAFVVLGLALGRTSTRADRAAGRWQR